MESAKEVSWKLALCPECGQRQMMPTMNHICLACERESRPPLYPEDLRWVISFRGPESFVRGAWMLASPDMSAAMGLDLRTGMVTAHRWGAGEEMPVEESEGVIILAVCPAHRRAELPGLLAAGADGMLSEEDAEELAAEVVVKSALGDGGERFWNSVDDQLAKLKESNVPENR